MADLTITGVETFLTQPNTQRLIVVKVLTSEPGLYGLGCATFTQRAKAVVTAVAEYLRPLFVGRDAARIGPPKPREGPCRRSECRRRQVFFRLQVFAPP